MTVSVDAAPDSFVFYSSGIYNNSACHSAYDGKSSELGELMLCHLQTGTMCTIQHMAPNDDQGIKPLINLLLQAAVTHLNSSSSSQVTFFSGYTA